MSKNRMVNTRFWKDVFIADKCNALDRLLFLYLLTNEQTNMIGIYEVSLRTVAMETGIDRDDVEKMLKRLSPKIEYLDDGWVYIRNFAEHQQNNPNIEKGMARDAESLPQRIRGEVVKLGLDSERLSKAFKGFQRLEEPKPNLTLTKPKLKPNGKTQGVAPGMGEATEIIAYYNSVFSKSFSDLAARRNKINLRLKTFSVEQIKTAIDNAKSDNFFNGGGNRGWFGDLDYLIRNDINLEKYLLMKGAPSLTPAERNAKVLKELGYDNGSN